MLSNSAQLRNPLFNHFSTYFYNKSSFLFFSRNPTCLLFHCHTRSNTLVSQSFQYSASVPTSLVWRSLYTKQHKRLPPPSDAFSCVQGFPWFCRPGFVHGKFTSCPALHLWTARPLIVPACHLLPRGSSNEPWQISCSATALVCSSTRRRGKVRIPNSVAPVHSLLRVAAGPYCRKYLSAEGRCQTWEERKPLHLKLPFKQTD